MSYLTLTDVITDLYGRLAVDPSRSSSAPVNELPLVTQVYDHEPQPGAAQKPVAVTLFPTGIDPEFFRVTLRIYASVDTDPRGATRNLETTIAEIDRLLPSTVGPSSWTIVYSQDLDAIVGGIELSAGREDYF